LQVNITYIIDYNEAQDTNGSYLVFLRVLEYYAGILFLTTNRVGDFDEAFASRIHISLYYPELTAEFAPEVFNINLNLIESRFTRKGRLFKTDRMRIGSFCERYWRDHPFDQWNGRQIRNACLTAVALAEFEAQGENANDILKPKAEVELKVSHFEQVAKAYLEFSEHMRNIYGTHAARRAKEAGLRAMWVDEKGKLVASVGPKESGILKGSRKNKFLQVASGQVNYGGPEQPQQQRQSMPYRGGGRAAGEHGYEPEQRSYYQGPERHHEEYGGNLPRPQGYRERDYEQADYKGDYRDNANQRLDAPRDTRFRGPPNRSQERPHPNQDSRYD
jgi:hypothetical protein